jgi:acetyl-CoA synthetase
VQLHLPAAHGRATRSIAELSEYQGKTALARFGLKIPRGRVVAVACASETAAHLGFPVVMKAASAELEHKTDAGGVMLNIRSTAEAAAAAQQLAKLSPLLLVEEMFTDGVAEILIGVTVDEQFGQVLTLGAGGVFAEIMADSVSLLPPWSRASIAEGLERLTIAKLFAGYRGKPAADLDSLIGAVLSVARYAAANVSRLVELDVNPLIVRPSGRGAVAVDTMIRLQNLEGA